MSNYYAFWYTVFNCLLLHIATMLTNRFECKRHGPVLTRQDRIIQFEFSKVHNFTTISVNGPLYRLVSLGIVIDCNMRTSQAFGSQIDHAFVNIQSMNDLLHRVTLSAFAHVLKL